MKTIYKWILGGIAIIVLAMLAALGYGYYLLKSEAPKYGLTINLPGLEKPVEVVFDKWGVPHVFGGSYLDIAGVLGYLHARDRLWQMDLMRRAASGRLAEIVGESVYESDVFQRVIGFERFAKSGFEKLDPESRAILQAYADGVNAFINTHPETPTVEFRALGYKMEPWQPQDSIMLARMTGWQLSANMTAEILRFALIAERGEEAGWALMPRHSDPGPYIIPPREKRYGGQGARNDTIYPLKSASYNPKALIRLLEIEKQVRNNIGSIAGTEFASNSWVVSPKKTASGGAILCNDPHLDLLLPSVWHESHLVGDDINVAGVAFPGTPSIVLGHTPHIAWGATTTVADTQDLYILKINEENPDEYLYDGQWVPFEIVEETIKIRRKKGFNEKTVKVRISRHGPVITDSIQESHLDLPPLALRWTGYEATDEIKAIFNIARATDWDEFLEAFKDFGVPIQNWVYADADGNIGYIANGLLPIRAKGDGTLPAPGDDPEYEWQGFVPQDQLPQLTNPSSGFIATANNKVAPADDYPFIVSFRYAPPYRAMRITEVLKSKNKLTVQDMSDLQMDNKMLSAQRLLKYFLEAYDKKGDKSDERLKKLVVMLKNWDFHTPTSSIPTLFFMESYRQAFKLTYEDEMSEELFHNFREDTSAWNGFDNGIENDFGVFDDRRTDNVESRDDILVKAMTEAVRQLSNDMGDDLEKWLWGKRHGILFNHLLFGNIHGITRKTFSLGPYELAGSRDTVNNGFFNWFIAPYRVWQGPSLRHIVDYGKFEDSRITITTGQSLHLLSPHYSDQVNDWLEGGYHPMPMTREGVEKIAEGSIKFVP